MCEIQHSSIYWQAPPERMPMSLPGFTAENSLTASMGNYFGGQSLSIAPDDLVQPEFLGVIKELFEKAGSALSQAVQSAASAIGNMISNINKSGGQGGKAIRLQPVGHGGACLPQWTAGLQPGGDCVPVRVRQSGVHGRLLHRLYRDVPAAPEGVQRESQPSRQSNRTDLQRLARH